MPTEKTKQDYRKLAAHFYEQRLGDEPPPKQRRAKSTKPEDAQRLRDTLLERGKAAGYSQ